MENLPDIDNKKTPHEMARGLFLSITVTTIICVFIIAAILLYKDKTWNFEKGKFGKKCYPFAQADKNIKYPLYFDTMENCQKTLI